MNTIWKVCRPIVLTVMAVSVVASLIFAFLLEEGTVAYNITRAVENSAYGAMIFCVGFLLLISIIKVMITILTGINFLVLKLQQWEQVEQRQWGNYVIIFGVLIVSLLGGADYTPSMWYNVIAGLTGFAVAGSGWFINHYPPQRLRLRQRT